MPAFVTFGRFCSPCSLSIRGRAKLFGIQATADLIAAKIGHVPPSLYTLYDATGSYDGDVRLPQMLAIAVGAFEVIAGLMIALNFGVRFFAILLIFFVAATFYFRRFLESGAAGGWQDPDGRAEKSVDHRCAVHHRRIRPASADGRAGLWRRLIGPPPWRDADAVGGVEDLRARRLSGRARLRISCGERSGTPGKQGSPPGSRPAAPATARTCRSGP